MEMSTASPLEKFTVFQTADLEEARSEVARIFCPHELVMRDNGRSLDARHNHAELDGFSLDFVQYGSEVLIDPGYLGGFYLLQLPYSGSATIKCGSETVVSSGNIGSLLSPTIGTSMVWDAECKQLMVKLPRATVERTFEGMVGTDAARPIEFACAFPIGSAAGTRFRALIEFIRADLDSEGSLLANRLVAVQMREALVISLLKMQPHSHSRLLMGPTSPAAPRYVKRAEDFMAARIDQPITIADLVDVTGVSARTLHQGFRRFRDSTPMAALRRMRLERARADLLAREPGSTVTSIALKWGFCHLGRFSTDYLKRFREHPSQTLRAEPPNSQGYEGNIDN